MKEVTIRTVAEATVEEEWVVRVGDTVALLLDEDPNVGLDVLEDPNLDVVSVTDVKVYNEHDRVIKRS